MPEFTSLAKMKRFIREKKHMQFCDLCLKGRKVGTIQSAVAVGLCSLAEHGWTTNGCECSYRVGSINVGQARLHF